MQKQPKLPEAMKRQMSDKEFRAHYNVKEFSVINSAYIILLGEMADRLTDGTEMSMEERASMGEGIQLFLKTVLPFNP